MRYIVHLIVCCLLSLCCRSQPVFALSLYQGACRTFIGADSRIARTGQAWEIGFSCMTPPSRKKFSAALSVAYAARSLRFDMGNGNTLRIRQQTLALIPEVRVPLSARTQAGAAFYFQFPNYSVIWLQSRDWNGAQAGTSLNNYYADYDPRYLQPAVALLLRELLGDKRNWSIDLTLLQQVTSFILQDYSLPVSTAAGRKPVLSANNRPFTVLAGVTYYFSRKRDIKKRSADTEGGD